MEERNRKTNETTKNSGLACLEVITVNVKSYTGVRERERERVKKDREAEKAHSSGQLDHPS